jgi:outer membrane protein TolC
MKRTYIITLCLSCYALLASSQTTLEQCQQAAEQNYPLIKQRDLIARTTDLTVSNLGKAWLPQVNATAQATLQSDVAAWPEQMQAMLDQTGLDIKGLKKDQYRVGIDVNQTVWDGGTISAQQDIARQQGAVQALQTEVSLYTVRKRVNEMYFGLLLLDEQISLNNDLQRQLESSEKKLESLSKRGAAAECDYHAIKAERLGVSQQLASLQASRQTLARLLSAFCGLEVHEVVRPHVSETATSTTGTRPELRLADAQLRLVDAQERMLNANLMPRLSVFASGFYGYPGYNMFEDMMSHKWSLNGMIGARLTWNLGALYTRRGDKAKLALQRASAENNREVFLFNQHLEQTQSNEDIERYRQMIATDQEIIGLRSSVRKAAESKLAHGIIDVNDLIKEINAENAARVQQAVHQIEMLKAIYELKYTTNN